MFAHKLSNVSFSAKSLLGFCCCIESKSKKSKSRRTSGYESGYDEADSIKSVAKDYQGSQSNLSEPVQQETCSSDRGCKEIPKVPIKRKKKKKGAQDSDKTELQNGAAYQYDDETSSDSDDEMQKRYQESLVAKGSVRSAKSRKSAKITNSSSGNLQKEESASLAEKGVNVAGTVSPPLSADEEGDQELQTEKAGSGPLIEIDDLLTYENKAFQKEPSATGELVTEPSASGGSPSESTEALSGTGTTKMSSDEHLFDVSDLQTEPPLISKCGSIEVSFDYEPAKGRMVITVHQAKEIPAKDRGGASNIQLRLMLLPTKKLKFKTKVKTGESPVFEETFVLTKIFPDDVQGMGVRFRLYGLERMRRDRMIGETIVGFASMSLDEKQTHWVVLEPRSNLSHGDSGFDVSSLSRSDSASSTQSLQHGGMPELLVGLAYNGTTGRLSVEVIKGSNFRNMAMNRAPDTYVKLTLMSPTGQELQRCKTSVRRGQPNPLFKETFMFQVALFQLPEVTLMVSVYNKKSMKKKEMIGWFSLGMNSSGEEEQSHWSDMRENKGDQVCRWHVLLES